MDIYIYIHMTHTYIHIYIYICAHHSQDEEWYLSGSPWDIVRLKHGDMVGSPSSEMELKQQRKNYRPGKRLQKAMVKISL